MFLSYHNRASTKRYSSCLFSPHTAGTSGTTCVGLTKIVPLRGTGSLHSLWLGRTKARPYRVERGCYGSANIGRFEMRQRI